jgi:malate dehydrogenase
VGVPAILGSGGVEKIVEIDLTPQERADFTKSVEAVKSLVSTMNQLMAAPQA